MARMKLQAASRNDKGTWHARHMRAAGKVPAVLYGKGETTTPLAVDASALEAALRAKARMIDLDVDGTVHTTFLKEVQRDAIEDILLHVDFHRVRMDQLLRAKVSVHLKGIPAGAAEGGVVTQLLHEVLVECLPADLPEAVECGIAHLKLDEAVHLKDLKLPARVKAIGDPGSGVVQVQKPKKEELAAAEGEVKEPELIRKERAEGEVDEEGKEGDAKEKDRKPEPAKPEEGKKKG